MINFFKVLLLKEVLNHKSNIICYCSNVNYIVFCYMNEVEVFRKDWKYFTLNVKDIKLCCIDDSDGLILLSQDSVTNKICLKMYSISNRKGCEGASFVSSRVLEHNYSKVTVMTAFNITKFQLCLSIGLDNGCILFYKGSTPKEKLPNTFKYFNVTMKPIKGIKFSKNKDVISMFVCSDGGIFCYTVTNTVKINETKLILDDMDSQIHCIAMQPFLNVDVEPYLVVATDEGLYCFTAEGRGPCYPMSGNKQIMEWIGKQFVILIKSNSSLDILEHECEMLIYDVENKIIVLNRSFKKVECVLPSSRHSNCFIILRNGKIFTLREHDLRHKLSHLFKNKIYDVALRLLKQSKGNRDVSDILVRYGDYFLQCGNLSSAVDAYSKTIGTTSPVLVIKKLIAPRFNESLIQYLSELVKTEFETPEYSELASNCARRMNLSKRVNRLFETEEDKYKQLHVYYATVYHKSDVKAIVDNLKLNRHTSVFREYPNTDVRLVSDYGYSLIKGNLSEFEEFAMYLLSENLQNCDMVKKILISLSLMNKLSAKYLIDKLIKDSDRISIYIILLELILLMWYKKQVSTNFVIEFFKSDGPEVHFDNIFVLCRFHEFWPGIKVVNDKFTKEILSTNCLLKCFASFPEYFNTYWQECNNKLNQVMIHTIRNKIVKNCGFNYVADIVRSVINSNPYCILNIINDFVSCDDFCLLHLDSFFTEESNIRYFECNELYNVVLSLENRLHNLEELSQKYTNQPMEFRNRICDICHQILKPPSIFFLCQHSFHRKCYVQLGKVNVCIVCTKIKKYRNICVKSLSAKSENSRDRNDGDKNILLDMSNQIAHLLELCGKEFNTENVDNTNTSHQELQTFPRSIYDDNLNPFSSK